MELVNMIVRLSVLDQDIFMMGCIMLLDRRDVLGYS